MKNGSSVGELDGLQKAAVLLITLGPEKAANIFKHLKEEEIEQLTLEIANTRSVSPSQKEEVLNEFYEVCLAQQYIAEGGIGYAKDLLQKALGEEKAKDVLGKLTASLQVRPFEFIRKTDASQILNFIQDEHPQTIALILSYLSPSQAAGIVGSLPPDKQTDVAKRIATMDRTSPDVIKEVEDILEQKLASLVSQDYTIVGGVDSVVAILNTVDRGTEKHIMENLEIEKGANELVIEKRSLELELQKSKKENYLYISLLLLALCAVFYIFFRLGKMRSLYRALQKSNELVLIANQKAQESEEMKTAFIRNMSHEIRTPLNAINGFSELITNDDISMDEKQAFSRIIYENCYHLTSMLNNLLEIAQLDSGNDSLPLVPTRIHELCLHEMQQVKKYQEKPEINYVVEGDKENDMILTNRAYFSLIISHLLANANKFTEKGSITLSYHLDSGANLVTLSVTDTGCGIPQDKQEWIFERFTKTNDFIPGSGLGLYLCRLIVNRLNGKIKTDPSYTKGSRFVITMPIATPSKPSEPTD